jgi:hypothetical protein
MMLRLARERQVELRAMATSKRTGTSATGRLSRLLNTDVVLRWRSRRAWRGPRETSGG